MKPTDADMPHNCPHGHTSLLGDSIPQDIAHHYSGKFWKREIGVEDPTKYDGIYYWLCPDCGGTWGGYQALEEKLK